MALTPATRLPWLAVGLLTLAVMVVAGDHFYRSAANSLCNGSATMDTLVALGAGAAWLYSISVVLWPQAFPAMARHLYFETSAMIIGLINLGHALAQVAPGMTLRLTSGDRVPVDGDIFQGEVWLDESILTGEPAARHKQAGARVHAGTVVADGSVLFTARATGNQNTLARIIRLVRQALGLATPMSIIAGVGRAAEFGVPVRDADALQQATQIDMLVFDKTGTLTEGRPLVVAIELFSGWDSQRAMILAAAIEQGSSHSLAHAIRVRAQEEKDAPALAQPEQFRTLRGLSVSASLAGQQILLSNAALLTQQWVDAAAGEARLRYWAQ